MKIILSRKGFDSESGGWPSPILPDGRLISLPIPSEDFIHYSDVKVDRSKTYYDLMKELMESINYKNKKIPLTAKTGCHLDPDINFSAKERDKQWRPLFGQIGSAQGHLNKQSVRENDLFLFFGTFQKTVQEHGKLRFDPKEKEKHVIFGYLQIGKIIRNKKEVEEWMEYHSHCDSKRDWRKNNTVYVAREKLSWNKNLPGAGLFRYNEDLILTAEGCSKSRWHLPDCFKGKISYHTEKCWEGNIFNSVGRGQEFVAQEDVRIEKWAKDLIEKSMIV